MALQRLPIPRAFENDFAPAMAAYVSERAHRALGIARYDGGNIAESHG